MSKTSDFNTFNWFADPEEPNSTGLFEVPSDKNDLSPYSKFESTVKTLELRVYNTLKNHKFGMFSQSKKIIKQLHSNFKKYSSKLPDHELFKDFSPQEKLKKMTEVEKLIKTDNKKIVELYSKIYNKYKNEEDEKKRPRIIELDNEKNLLKGLDNLFKFAQKCVNMQSELRMDDTKKGEKQFLGVDESGKAKYDDNKIEKLAKAFTDDDPFGNMFIKNFSQNETVKEYIKKRLSKTGKRLKDICKFINDCGKAFYALDVNIQKTLYTCKTNEKVSSCSHFKKIADDKNNYNKYISQLNTAINAYSALVNLLSSIANYRGELKKLISLYDPRVKNNIKELVKKLHNQIEMYKEMKDFLKNQ